MVSQPRRSSCREMTSRFSWLSSTRSTVVRRRGSRAPAAGDDAVPAASAAGPAAVCAASTSTPLHGTAKKKTDPAPSSLQTTSSPPRSSTISRQIARPSPDPPNDRVDELSPCWNGSNSASKLAGAMPAPVSITANQSIGVLCMRRRREGKRTVELSITAARPKNERPGLAITAAQTTTRHGPNDDPSPDLNALTHLLAPTEALTAHRLVLCRKGGARRGGGIGRRATAEAADDAAQAPEVRAAGALGRRR